MKLPSLLKHMTMAIYESNTFHESGGPRRFEAAFEAARNRLVEYGFLTHGSEKGPVEKIGLTSKGAQRENKHKFGEGRANAKKNAAFDALYVKVFGKDDVGDPTAVKKDPKGKSMPPNKASSLKPPPEALKSPASPLKHKGESLQAKQPSLQPKKVPLKDQF